ARRVADRALRRAGGHPACTALRPVRPAADRARVMRPTGLHHTPYAAELRLRHTRGEHVRLALLVAMLAALPLALNNYWLAIANTIGIAAIGAIGLNILVGFTGQLSLGQGGFLA